MFEPNKNAKQLGIDTSRKFVVCGGGYFFNKGDIIELYEDGNTSCPQFRRISDGKIGYKSWEYLDYADEPTFKEGRYYRVRRNESAKQILKIINGDQRAMSSASDPTMSRKTDWLPMAWDKEDIIYEYSEGTKLEDIDHYEYKNPEYFNKGLEALRGINRVFKNLKENKLINEPKSSLTNKTMSLIKNALKSKENQALEYFNLGDTKELNSEGLMEYLAFVYEKSNTNKPEDINKENFLKKIVELWKEKTKK